MAHIPWSKATIITSTF